MIRRLLKWMVLLGLGALVVVAVVLLHDMPSARTPVEATTVTVLDRHGAELAVYGTGGARAASLESLPPHLIDAVVAIEDRRFFSHFGLDPIGILRAVISNISSGRVVQGGSTLTQQLAKNLYLGPQRTLKRKAQEAVLAVILEMRHSKDEILEMYLNRVYLGAGAYGVEAAAARYFARSAKSLDVRQSAMIAGLLKAPSFYDPTRNPTGAQERMRLVVEAMVDSGRLDAAAAKGILAAPALPVGRPRNEGIRYATDFAREQAAALVGNNAGNIIVRTSIDRRIQDDGARIMDQAIASNSKPLKVTQGALVLMTNQGAIRALVGGANYGRSQYNRAVRSRRQPGSAMKPFFYLAALEAGYGPGDLIDDSPVRVGDWQPRNYRNRYLGKVTLTEALARSANAASVRLAEQVGRTEGVAAARRLGIDSTLPDHPSVVLGTAEVGLVELAAAYVPFASGGAGVTPFVVVEVQDDKGKVLYERRGSGLGQVISKTHAAEMATMLQAVIRDGSGKGATLPGRQAGGKTGTTQDNRDAWFAGFTADFTAVVWVGNDDNSPMRNVSGAGLPTRIWRDMMASAHAGIPAHTLPQVEIARGRDTAEDPAEDRSGIWGRIRTLLDSGTSSTDDDKPFSPEIDSPR